MINSIAENNAIVAKRNGKNFFDSINDEFQANPKAFNDRYDNAVKKGKNDSDDFLNKVKDFEHPRHEASLKTFKDKYKNSPDAVKKDCIANAIKDAGAKQIDFRDASRENKMLSTFKVKDSDGSAKTCDFVQRNDMDGATLAKFRATMNAQWNAQGYDGDTDVAEDFWKNHSLSTDPAEGVQRSAGVEKKASY